jgi:nucleoside-diphosphate-sugar epimerase
MGLEVMNKLGTILVTGGTGFVGSYLTKRLVEDGYQVTVLDNNTRGRANRLDPVMKRINYVEGDVTNYEQVDQMTKGINTVFHLAFINGTDNFYNFPEKVLEVGVKGALNTLDACMKNNVENYVLTSSSEVYQQPTTIPTPEDERLIIPDIKNPRFSYSGGKMISELLTLHYPAKSPLKTYICRPHNFYGPDMGVGHVIPQIINRLMDAKGENQGSVFDFPIQGTGEETRAFCYIDDAIDGILQMTENGNPGELYHIGTQEEVTVSELVLEIARQMELKINIVKGELLEGSTKRRCPDIKKLSTLGYTPQYNLRDGLTETIKWYVAQHLSGPKGDKNSSEILR